MMNSTTQLVPVLQKLHLSGVISNLEHRAREAAEDRISYEEFLFRVLNDEVRHRTRPNPPEVEFAVRAPRARPPMQVGTASRWFEVAGQEQVDLSRRGPIRRILEALVEQHLAGEERALDVNTMVSVGWPGEQVPPEAGATRVYTAIRTLRRMGLEGLLLTRDEGYLLDPKVRLIRVED